MPDFLEQLQSTVGGTYRIEEELGGGGMSRVFLAEEVALGRRVVIKVLPPEMAAEVSKDRFLREIQLAAKLQHPHVVPLLTAGSGDDLLYYVMPYIEGESLRSKLHREGELPVGEAVRILKEVIDALAYAHKQGVVHRDIKPDNVMISSRHALVTDFGVAKAVTTSGTGTSLTSLGIALGTPAYMAPEQAAADPHTDHRADIYAVGALAYEMLAGEPPFTGPTPQAVMGKHVTEAPQPVAMRRPAVSEELQSLVMRCLEKRPADRWQSAAELLPQVEALTTPSGGMTPTGTQPVEATSAATLLQKSAPARVAALFGMTAVAVLAVTYILVLQLGLPYWVLSAAVVLFAVSLPVVMHTGRAERRRASARLTGVVADEAAAMSGHWFTWRKTMLGSGLALGGLVVVTALYMAMRLLGIGPAGTLLSSGVLEERDRIVLAQFENRTSDSTLGATVTDLFRMDVALSPAIVLLEPSQVGVVLSRMMREPDELLTAELAREVAEREGLKALLVGELMSVGSGYAISSRLIQVSTGDVLWAAREPVADDDEIMSAVDRLSAKLRERIGESLRSIRAEPPLWRYSTTSLEALRKYTEAVRVNDEGDYQSAIGLLEEAVELDSMFAMAHRKLGIVLANTRSDRDRVTAAYTRAYTLRDRLTDRERYLVEEVYERSVNLDRQASITALRRLLEQYPEDRIGLSNLGLQYGRQRRWADSEHHYRRLIGLGYAGAVAYADLINVQVAQGNYAAAESTLAQFNEAFPSNLAVSFGQANLAASRGDFQTARQPLQEALARTRGNMLVQPGLNFVLATFDIAEGKLRSAERLISRGVGALEERGQHPAGTAFSLAGFLVFADVWYRDDPQRAAGRIDDVLRRYPIDSLDPMDRPYLSIAEMYADVGKTAQAREWLTKFETELDEGQKSRQPISYHRAKGWVAAAETRFQSAIAEFREAHELAADPIAQLFNLATTFDRAGQVDSAIAYFTEYLETPYLFRTRSGSNAIAHRRLGALFEQRDEVSMAVNHYNQFIELWNDADADLQPQVQDARERIARLVGER